jgi:hypothetical protein
MTELYPYVVPIGVPSGNGGSGITCELTELATTASTASTFSIHPTLSVTAVRKVWNNFPLLVKIEKKVIFLAKLAPGYLKEDRHPNKRGQVASRESFEDTYFLLAHPTRFSQLPTSTGPDNKRGFTFFYPEQVCPVRYFISRSQNMDLNFSVADEPKLAAKRAIKAYQLAADLINDFNYLNETLEGRRWATPESKDAWERCCMQLRSTIVMLTHARLAVQKISNMVATQTEPIPDVSDIPEDPIGVDPNDLPE